MHDFDYDAMQKKRIARGAMHMKNGSKSKKCSLPHDGLTPAQLRRLNGPVSTYKLDEPMTRESFGAMPKDLQKKYLEYLQETYRANDTMIGKMFGVTNGAVYLIRKRLGVASNGTTRLSAKETEIRDAKWEAFCNGVVGGKPGEPGEPKEESVEDVVEQSEQLPDEQPVVFVSTEEDAKPEPIDLVSVPGIPVPSRLDVTFVEHLHSLNDLYRIIKTLHLPRGKCRIRISIEKFSERSDDRQSGRKWEDR